YWLQTEAPRPGGAAGFPELRLRPDVMGSADGLSKHPYIRESRRDKALKTVVEQEVSADYQAGPRAANFPDSVGVGWYPIDIHRAGEEDVGVSCRTKPFQIPLGALIPLRLVNLLAAAKNIGTTHITNGCYRLHPVEWNIGEAAGSLAAFALETGRSPRAIYGDPTLVRAFQRRLLDEGVPLYWLVDVPLSHGAFAAVQRLAMAGVVEGANGTLEFRPDAPALPSDRARWVERALGRGTPDPAGGQAMTRAECAMTVDTVAIGKKGA
ncbi:MAG: FAD-dependent oxidoreductase, partial [Candidatus Rokubacteria bacterium]|nr:FAD-dependent oxidoreductase [Candidatus Rokubacteria bacterium]